MEQPIVPKPPVKLSLVQVALIAWVELDSLPADAEATSAPRQAVAIMAASGSLRSFM